MGELTEHNQFTHEELKKAHTHGPMGVLAIDADGIVTYANAAALAYSSSKGSGIIGQPLFSLFGDPSPDKLNEAKIAQLQEITDQEFIEKSRADNRWALVSTRVFRDANDEVQTYLFIHDISRHKKKEDLFSYLNQAATALAETRSTSDAMEQIAKFIVPKFANWFTIDLLKDNRIELLFLKHEDPAKVKWAHKYRKNYPPEIDGDSGAALVIKTGKPGFVPVVTDAMIDALITDPVQRKEIRKIGLNSVIIVPMFQKGVVTGLVNFIISGANRHFDEIDLEFAQNFANLISLSLENARLNEDAANEIILKKQNEEKFRFLTDAITHKLWTSGPDGGATYYNQQWYDYTGIRGFEALKESVWEFIHPEDRAVAVIEWPKAIRKGEPTEIEHRLLRYDGVYRWHISRFTPHKNEDGQIVLWIGTSTDIHEQKLATIELAALNEELAATNEEFIAANEELVSTNDQLIEIQASLARSEKLFRSIALNIPKSLIIVIDRNHRYIAIEGDIMGKMGYDRRNYEGRHPAELSPERYAASKDLYDRVIGGERFSVERKSENGENYIVHFVPLLNEYNDVDAGLIIALDITDIKQAEEKSANFAAIVASTDDAIVSKTLESVITSWNDSAVRMFGYTAEEMIGETIYKIIPPDRTNEEPQILSRLKKGERVEHFETKRLTKDGRLLDVSLTISPVKDKQGNIIGLSKIARDITEKKLEEQRKNDFIGMVSHELKTPLTSLNAIIQLAGAKLRNSEDVALAGTMARAHVQVKKMTTMINGFLNVSRLEAGKMLIEKELFDIGELLEEMVDETRLIVSTHKIILTGCKPIQIYADRNKISSVVSNLLGNAVKYSSSGTTIELNCQILRDAIKVSIKDQGMGINPNDLAQIFHRYYRVEATSMRHIAGFGIGLYLSAEIIKQHGGNIWAESVIGEGSTFYFTLPLVGG